MIPVARFEKFLNYLLIFLLPTQFALHFWPPFAFVFGIRVDYLSPAIYLTDVLFLLLFGIWVQRNYKKFFDFLKNNQKYLVTLVLIAGVNIAFSISFSPSIYKWLKIFEVILFAYYVWIRGDLFNKKIVLDILFYSLLFFSLIGIGQFIFGNTLGGPLYFLGERNFNILTPGIALADIFGKNYLRAYSTFSHPNSLAGYLGLGLIVLFFSCSKKELVEKITGLIIIISAFILTFSFSATLGLAVCVICFLIPKLNFKRGKIIISFIFLVSVLLPFGSVAMARNRVKLSDEIGQRLDLAFKAGKIISQNLLFGSGLNTFVIKEPSVGVLGNYQWLLQPVHNIYLLIFSEVGIFGLVFVFILLVKTLQNTIRLNKQLLLVSVFFVLTTGLFDHFWFTLQQNMFLLAFVLGNSLREKS